MMLNACRFLYTRTQGFLGLLLFKWHYRVFLKRPVRQSNGRAQALLRRAFIYSQGRSTKWAHKLQRKRTPHLDGRAIASSLFRFGTPDGINTAVSDLREKGFHVLEERLSPDWLAATNQALGQMLVTSRSDPQDRQELCRIAPSGPTYWHDAEDLSRVPELRAFVMDPILREIIGRYLGCSPVFDFATAWWSFPNPEGVADSGSAQLYHFDMDRVRWIKVFCYLTDVTLENGPHAFIAGSHNSVHQHAPHDGRYADVEVFQHYPRSAEVLLTGPAGTVFLEDTLGFHKGVPVEKGRRGVFEFEYSINHYGYPHRDLWAADADSA